MMTGRTVPPSWLAAAAAARVSPPVWLGLSPLVDQCTSCGGVLEDGLHWCDGTRWLHQVCPLPASDAAVRAS